MKVNLHTHTARCNHAFGTDEEYVLAAIDAGFTRLGFSDHTPFPYTDGYVNTDKMKMDELEGYIASVLSLREKYRDRIEILLGLECEAVGEFFPFLREIRERMDYLILGNHGDKRQDFFFHGTMNHERLWRYVESAVAGMETGLFLYIAHPDICFITYPEFDAEARQASRILCQEANRNHVPLEYNLYGVLKGKPENALGYPWPGFWEIAAEENALAVLGVDAHRPEMLRQLDVPDAQRFLRNLGLRVLTDPMEALDMQKGVAPGDILR